MLEDTNKIIKINSLLYISISMLIFNLILIIISSSLGIFDRPVYIIFFYHVSSAWLSYFSFFISLIYHILYLKQRKLIQYRVARSSVIVGIFFAGFTLISGSLWYNATSGGYQNVYWQWNDPRQTTTLALFLTYLVYLVLGNLVEERDQIAKFSAVYGIIIFPTVPFSYISSIIFRSLHPLITPNPNQSGYIYWDSIKLFILLFNLVSITTFYFYLVQQFMKLETRKMDLEVIIQKKINEE